MRGSRLMKTWLQYLLLFAALCFCAVLASVSAASLMERRYHEAVAATTLRSVEGWMREYTQRLEKALENSLLVNAYALESNLFHTEAGSTDLDRYAIYLTLRNSCIFSEYLSLSTLYEPGTDTVYDSRANMSLVEDYKLDPGIAALAEKNRDPSPRPLDTLGYYIRRLPISTYSVSRSSGGSQLTSMLTAVLSRKDGFHVIVNTNLDRFYRDLQSALRQDVDATLILVAEGLTLSELPEEEALRLAAACGSPEDVPAGGVALPREGLRLVCVSAKDFDLHLYAAVSDAAIREQAQDSLRQMQNAQIGLFTAYTLIFAVLLLLFLRPIMRLLRKIPGVGPVNAQKQKRGSIFQVNEMLESVVEQTLSLGEFRSEALPVYTTNLLAGLLTDKLGDPAQTLASLASHGLRFAPGPWYTAALELSGPDDESLSVCKRFIIRRGGELLPPGEGFLVDLNGRRIGAACHSVASHGEDGRAFMDAFLNRLRDTVLSPLERGVTVAVGRQAAGVEALRPSWSEAAEALEYRSLFSPEECIEVERLSPRRGLLSRKYGELEARLLQSVRTGNVAQAEALLSEFFDHMWENRYHIGFREVTETAVTLSWAVLAESPAPGAEISLYELYRRVSGATRQGLRELLGKLVADAAVRAGVGKDEFPGDNRRLRVVHTARAYIDIHYAKDLSLDFLAEYVGLNPSYFSTLFKEALGVSFTQYLKNRRLDEAARLIRAGNSKIAQVAEAVGYHSHNYFTKDFRKKTGLTPEEYRRNAAGDGAALEGK